MLNSITSLTAKTSVALVQHSLQKIMYLDDFQSRIPATLKWRWATTNYSDEASNHKEKYHRLAGLKKTGFEQVSKFIGGCFPHKRRNKRVYTIFKKCKMQLVNLKSVVAELLPLWKNWNFARKAFLNFSVVCQGFWSIFLPSAQKVWLKWIWTRE